MTNNRNDQPFPLLYDYSGRCQICQNKHDEEVMHEFTDDQGTQAIVTRNAYGSLILNTRDLMFIDVDFPFSFGQPDPVSPAISIGNQIHEAAAKYPQICFRIYRTRNGFRVMVIDRAINADSDQSHSLLEDFDADPLYSSLCVHQSCFRARLTPKPWRCQVPLPPPRCEFADADASQEAAYLDWEEEYVEATARFSTCDFVETIGNGQPAEAFCGLIELHDKLTKAKGSDPLA